MKEESKEFTNSTPMRSLITTEETQDNRNIAGLTFPLLLFL